MSMSMSEDHAPRGNKDLSWPNAGTVVGGALRWEALGAEHERASSSSSEWSDTRVQYSS